MRLLIPSLCLLLLATCGRPLTEGEVAFARAIHGNTIDTSRIRILSNGLVGITSRTYRTRPRTTCRELILPPSDATTFQGRTAGVVLGHTVNVREDFFVEDYTANSRDELNLVAAMFMAHEVTHVWQWQNRELTGYHPFKAAREHALVDDPYLFETETEKSFLDYGYEQQASLVEEYICCDTLDPNGARTARLKALLGAVMPLSELPTEGRAVRIPWAGAQLRGICG